MMLMTAIINRDPIKCTGHTVHLFQIFEIQKHMPRGTETHIRQQCPMAGKLLHSTLDGRDVRLVSDLLAIVNVSLVDLLLDSMDGLVGKGLVFEHCFLISTCLYPPNQPQNLQKVSSSKVRPYVSGYMKYTNKNSNVIQPQ